MRKRQLKRGFNAFRFKCSDNGVHDEQPFYPVSFLGNTLLEKLSVVGTAAHIKKIVSDRGQTLIAMRATVQNVMGFMLILIHSER